MSTARNFIVNLGGSVVGLFLFAALTPLYFHTIGAERFGVVTVILSLSMYVGTFNFGMGPALTYHAAGDLKANVAAQSEAFWSAMAISLPLGLLASIVIFGILPLALADVMHLGAVVRRELQGAPLPLIGIGLCLILQANIRGIWAGRQAFLTMAVMGAAEMVLTILFPVWTALYLSPSVSALLFATLAARILCLIAATGLCAVITLERRRPHFSFARVRSMMNYGGWVTLGTLVETVMSSADRLILGTVGGAAQIAFYSIPLSVTSRSMLIPQSLLGGIFPRMVEAEGERRTQLLSKTMRFLLLLTPGYVLVAAVAAPALRYWISADFADAATWSLQLLAVAFWLEMIAITYYYELCARGNTRANFVVAVTVIAPYVGALTLGAWLLGAAGVAIGYLVRNLLIVAMRARFARQTWAEIVPVLVNAVPVALVLLVAPSAWSRTTIPALLPGIGVFALSVVVCLWTRPHDFAALVRALLPARVGGPPRAAVS